MDRHPLPLVAGGARRSGRPPALAYIEMEAAGVPGALPGGCVICADLQYRSGVAPAMFLPAQNIRIMVAAKPVDKSPFRRGSQRHAPGTQPKPTHSICNA